MNRATTTLAHKGIQMKAVTKIELIETDTATLCGMAENLKADAKALQNTNRAEAIRLFRLWRQITEELRRRDFFRHVPYCQSFKYN